MRRVGSVVALLAGAALFLFAFQNGREWGHGYAQRYGDFVLQAGELALRLNVLLLALPASILIAMAAATASGPRLVEAYDAPPRRHRVAILALAVLAFAEVSVVREHVLHGTELTDDENVYALQARTIQSGHLFVPSPPEPFREFLDNQYVVNDGHRYGSYFVGHPAVLAAARALGFERWLGPLLAALVLAICASVARSVYGDRIALWSAVLLVVSPFYVCLFATRLSQPTSALFLALFTLAAVRLEETPRSPAWWALAATVFVAAVFTRPQTAVAFAMPLAVPVLVRAMRRRADVGLGGPAFALVILAAGAFAFLWVNAVRSGGPFRTGYAAYHEQGQPWIMPTGFGPAVRQAEQALNHLQFWLFGWPLSLAFVLFFRRTSLAWRLALAVLSSALLFAASGIPTVAPVGPVYYGEAIPILAILTASGVDRAVAWARSTLAQPLAAAALLAWPPAMTLAGLLTFVPVQLASMRQMAELTRLPYTIAEARGYADAVVFVSTLPGVVRPPGTWAYFHRNADPTLADPVLFVKDLGPDRNREFLRWTHRSRGFTLVLRDGKFTFDPLSQ
jgi:hypothetical protein